MKVIKVEITGKTPLLMNNPQQMVRTKSVRKTTEERSLESDAEKTAYKTKTGELYVPSRCVFASIINSAKLFKTGKQNMSSLLAGTIRIEPLELLLGTKKYEIDAQRVVIQRQGIIKARACLPDWKISFDLIYDDTYVGDPLILKQIIQDAGNRIGLLDFRPQRKGNYGTFDVSKFKEKK